MPACHAVGFKLPLGVNGRAREVARLAKQRSTGPSSKRGHRLPTIDYKEVLLEKLRDLEYAAGYLTACYEEGRDVFLLGIRDVAEANGGLRQLSRETELNRENLYDMLSAEGNPRLSSLSALLNQLGLEVAIRPRRQGGKVA